MMIVRHYVESFEDVVAFYDAWRPYAVPPLQHVPGLPPDWHGLGWRIEQQGDAGWCSIVLKS